MYTATYGMENKIINSDNLTIGVFSVGSKNFNCRRALYFLNKAEGQGKSKANNQAMNIKYMLNYINLKSTI